MTIPKPRIVYRWSDEEAENVYVLQKFVLDMAVYRAYDVAHGDKRWANKIAAHYRIIVPNAIIKTEEE